MPSTNYPKGVSVSTAMRTTDGELYAESAVIAGAMSVAGTFSAPSVIGSVFSASVTFGTASTAQILPFGSLPNFACDLIGAFVTVGSVSAIVAAYTVQGGSAGTVHVSSENNTSGVTYSKSSLAIDTAAIDTTAGVVCTRGVQGTAGDSVLSLLFRRTA